MYLLTDVFALISHSELSHIRALAVSLMDTAVPLLAQYSTILVLHGEVEMALAITLTLEEFMPTPACET